jgi:hypothetical protein
MLFDTINNSAVLAMVSDKNQNRAKCTAMTKLSEAFPDITTGMIYHYVSSGDWSMHNMLVHFAGLIGKSDVLCCSWSMSEPACSYLVSNRHLFGKFEALMDWRINVRCPQAKEMAMYNDIDIRLTSCHAKVYLMSNENYNVSIVSSANFTNNPRIESGVVFTDLESYKFYKKWIKEEFCQATKMLEKV